MSQRWTTTAALVAATALLAGGAGAAPAAAGPPGPGAGASADSGPGPGRAPAGGVRTARESARLAEGLAAAVRDAGFDQLVDFQTVVDGVAQPAAALPNVDVAVIELDRRGHVVGAANVLYDRDSPEGYVVALDRRTLQPLDVRFSQWRGERWDDQALWSAGPAPADVLAGPAAPDKDFMVPYPASVLKVMVAYGVLRLVDEGTVALDDPVTYHDVDGRSCAYGPSNYGGGGPTEADGATDTLGSWLEQMTTVSDNFATCVLLQLLHDTGGLERTNAEFARLGLTTLRMEPSQPDVGSGWSSGRMTMGALDTARLMLLVAGTKHELWRAPDGSRVTGDSGLSRASQAYYRSLLLDQSFHEVLSTGNLCGSSDAGPGIPALVPERWLDPETGNVVTTGSTSATTPARATRRPRSPSPTRRAWSASPATTPASSGPCRGRTDAGTWSRSTATWATASATRTGPPRTRTPAWAPPTSATPAPTGAWGRRWTRSWRRAPATSAERVARAAARATGTDGREGYPGWSVGAGGTASPSSARR
jgi:hypothetical protein